MRHFIPLSFILLISLFPLLISGFYSSSDGVTELTTTNFDSKVLKSDRVWIIEFYAPWCGHCKSLVPEWKKAAKALSGLVEVGAVDMTVHQSLGSPYNIQGFPTIKIFGANKSKPSDYNGAREASAIVEAAIKEVQTTAKQRLSGKSSSSGSSSSSSSSGGSGKVVTVTDSNFKELVLDSDDLYLVEFFAPWCGHCKNLAPHWEKAAADLAKQGIPVKLAALDATVNTAMASRYDIKGYPTIKIFKPGKKDKPEDYSGPREAQGIITFAKNLAETASPAVPKEVVQLTSQSVLDNSCGTDSGVSLCIVSFLPHILDSGAKGRNAYISSLKELATKYARKPFGFVWIEAGAQPELEEQLQVGGFGYPAVSVVNLKKNKYTNMKAAFGVESIGDFLKSLLNGKEHTEDLVKPVKIQNTEKWDGKDGKLPPVESDEL